MKPSLKNLHAVRLGAHVTLRSLIIGCALLLGILLVASYWPRESARPLHALDLTAPAEACGPPYPAYSANPQMAMYYEY